uniref:Uncharacterized protein n=1 Tax=Romanomermis culicivorax TaxID=13658 RepID=A0A915HI78_ROMCU
MLQLNDTCLSESSTYTYKLFQIEFAHPVQSAMCYSRPLSTVGQSLQSANRYSRSDGTVGHTVYNAKTRTANWAHAVQLP